jgi:hypothetical protein
LPWWLQIIVSPLMLPVMWFLLHRFRPAITDFIRRVPLPPLVKYLGFGLFFGVVLGLNFTISFGLQGTDHFHTGVPGADLHPNPLINTLLYFGPYGGTMLAWYLLRHFYVFDHRHVFVIAGLNGALVEPNAAAVQNFVVLAMVASGQVIAGLLTLNALIPAYGVPFASIWLVMPPEELPKGRRQPRWLGYPLLVVVPLVASFVSPLVSFRVIDALFGTHFLG